MKSRFAHFPLGIVENHLLWLQSRHGKMSIERQAVGTDGLALPGQAWRCRAKEARTGAWLAEAALWIVRTGSPWRDWPEEFGKCNTVFKRFRDGGKAISGKNSLMPSATRRICNTPWPMPRP